MGIKAKGWIVVKATRKAWGTQNSAGQYPVDRVRISKVAINRPSVDADEEAIEVEIEFPADYFDTNAPKVVVQVPSSQASTNQPIVVKAVVKPKAPSAAAAVINHGP